MKLAVAVHHDGAGALVAAVAFDAWDANEASQTWTTRIAEVEQVKPVRGQPDLRDLPCLLQLLREHALQPELIVIDGCVHLDPTGTPGLGHHLHQALGGSVAVIGASKASMPQMPAQFEVHREEEGRPLIVTCVGIDLGAAKARLRMMHGKRRVPTLLKLVGRMAKG
ncbi:endonuclease V [Sphaerotilus hippei]|uniref:Endonuclease V n=1 Tax=Sphaerotilus hippei TaxID=744406 RepID=A0A318H280_9BURK|nr:endonuclease V [Sphaerotilus hippei]PXW97440.1 endonuclease V [Sphaerotilus hippei]